MIDLPPWSRFIINMLLLLLQLPSLVLIRTLIHLPVHSHFVPLLRLLAHLTCVCVCSCVLVQTARLVLCQCRGIRWRLHPMLKAFTHKHSLPRTHYRKRRTLVSIPIPFAIRFAACKTISFFLLFLLSLHEQ